MRRYISMGLWVRMLGLVVLSCALIHPGMAHADETRVAGKARASKALRGKGSCARELRRLGVRVRDIKRRGIDIAVRVAGDIGGVTYRAYGKKPLDLDCSLVVSLAHLGPTLKALGITRATYSSAYQRRRVRGSSRWSKHSYGLAIDVHTFAGDELGRLSVRDDYEQGLGDDADCLGAPLTRGGATLRALYCHMEASGLFHSILTPDYDADHYNHFHIEAEPWIERETIAPTPTPDILEALGPWVPGGPGAEEGGD